MKKQLTLLASALAFTLLVGGTAVADEAKVIELTLKDHLFQPDRIEVEAGKDFILLVHNLDSEAEEFESKPLRLEKMIQGNSKAKIRVEALKPGEYLFVGEFHEETCKGIIVAQ